MRIDEMPDYRAQLPKSVHDLSHKFGFTATVAHLLPVFHDILNPGETVDLSFRYNLRTQPLASAAMVDIKAHVEYFFVPMFLLYEPFGSMFYDVNDQFSSLYPSLTSGNTVQDSFPVMDFWEDHSAAGATNNDLVSILNATTSSINGEAWFNMVYRLFDHFAYNNTTLSLLSTQANFNPNVFPWPILAYNCIYQYYYRLDTREHFDQKTFNWDEYFNTSVVDDSMWGYQSNIRIHRRPLDNDYFTDNKVSPIVDVLNLNSKSQFEIAKQWLTRTQIGTDNVLISGSVGDSTNSMAGSPLRSPYTNPGANIQTNFGFAGKGDSAGFYPLNGVDINTANIRAMFANEKFWSITGRARKHYDDQTLAHFGVKVPHDVKHQISCFGHDHSSIHIGEVISTSNIGVSSSGSIQSGGLGEIAGKGYGQMNNKPHRFTAPCHGVVMAILSFAPDYTYGRTYLKANAVTSRQDLYIPSYDHLGMQPLFGYEGYMEQGATIRNRIVGWQYRYEQWKRRYNRVSRAFTGSGSLDSWMLDYRPLLSTNAVQQPDVNNPNTVNYYPYTYHPWDLNQIMLVNYVTADGRSRVDQTEIYDGDPFVVDGYVYCKKRSSMSDYSLPRLDA